MSDLYERYRAIRNTLDEHSAIEISAQCRSAAAYVWGWQDAQQERDTDEATRFGWAYGIVAALYETYVIGFRPPIGSAFKSWRECGHIRDYWRGVETDLDLIDVPATQEVPTDV